MPSHRWRDTHRRWRAATVAEMVHETAADYPPPKQAWYTVGIPALCTTFAMLDQGILGLLIQQTIEDYRR